MSDTTPDIPRPDELTEEDIQTDIIEEPEMIETPLDPFDRVVLNPGESEESVQNPLCPVCEEPIRPHANQHQRVFVCGCDEPRRFEFGGVDDE